MTEEPRSPAWLEVYLQGELNDPDLVTATFFARHRRRSLRRAATSEKPSDYEELKGRVRDPRHLWGGIPSQ